MVSIMLSMRRWSPPSIEVTGTGFLRMAGDG